MWYSLKLLLSAAFQPQNRIIPMNGVAFHLITTSSIFLLCAVRWRKKESYPIVRRHGSRTIHPFWIPPDVVILVRRLILYRPLEPHMLVTSMVWNKIQHSHNFCWEKRKIRKIKLREKCNSRPGIKTSSVTILSVFIKNKMHLAGHKAWIERKNQTHSPAKPKFRIFQ